MDQVHRVHDEREVGHVIGVPSPKMAVYADFVSLKQAHAAEAMGDRDFLQSISRVRCDQIIKRARQFTNICWFDQMGIKSCCTCLIHVS